MREFKDSVTGKTTDQPELPTSTADETTASPRERETV
jgi:hypothetical protein